MPLDAMKLQTTELLTKRDVMRRASASLRTVDYWLQRGVIPYVKLGKLVRFVPDDVEKFIQAHRIGGAK